MGTHPRKARWAFLDWDFPGLRSAVHVDGTINDRSVVDRGWMVELAFPWAGMGWLANGRSLPPKDGDIWSIFFGRFEKIEVVGAPAHGDRTGDATAAATGRALQLLEVRTRCCARA